MKQNLDKHVTKTLRTASLCIQDNYVYAVKLLIENKNKTEILKSSEHINEKRDRPFCGVCYLSIFSDPLDFAKWSQRDILSIKNN